MLVRGIFHNSKTRLPTFLPACTDIRSYSWMDIGFLGRHVLGKRRRTQEP